MIVTAATADATTTNYDIVVVVLKASVVVDYYTMITAATGDRVDCTTVAVVVSLIRVTSCNDVMLLRWLLVRQMLLHDKLVSFQRDRRQHHAGAGGRRRV